MVPNHHNTNSHLSLSLISIHLANTFCLASSTSHTGSSRKASETSSQLPATQLGEASLGTMLARVLKTNTQQAAAPSPPTTPSKSRDGHVKSQSSSAVPVSSKIPVSSSSNPSSRSSHAKENSAPAPSQERSNYLSFLFSQSQQGAPTTPVKVNPKINQTSAPAQVHHAHATRDSDDVHMQTMKNTINPAMLKQLAAAPPAQAQAPAAVPKAANPYAPHRGHALASRASEDVHMKTQKMETRMPEKERGLQLWEREMLEKPDVRRKATVAQICELLFI